MNDNIIEDSTDHCRCIRDGTARVSDMGRYSTLRPSYDQVDWWPSNAPHTCYLLTTGQCREMITVLAAGQWTGVCGELFGRGLVTGFAEVIYSNYQV